MAITLVVMFCLFSSLVDQQARSGTLPLSFTHTHTRALFSWMMAATELCTPSGIAQWSSEEEQEFEKLLAETQVSAVLKEMAIESQRTYPIGSSLTVVSAHDLFDEWIPLLLSPWTTRMDPTRIAGGRQWQ